MDEPGRIDDAPDLATGRLPRALLTHPPEAEQAIEHLAAAADAYLAGEVDKASALVIAANLPQLRTFACAWMGPEALRLRRSTVRDPAFPRLKSGARMPPRNVQRLILERDGHRCRFCGVRVLSLDVRSAFSRAFPQEAAWPRDDLGKHAAFLALNATIDHVLPHARGGSNDPDNLVTACWPCNFSREDLLPHELGIADPRPFAPIPDQWDGLGRMLRRAPSRPAPPVVDGQWDRLKPLLDDLAGLGEQGVSWKLGKVLLIQVQAGGSRISPLAALPDGAVEAPWAIGPHKDLFRPFADRLAAALPGGRAYETPKMWRVGLDGAPLTVEHLVEARSEIRIALLELAERLRSNAQG